MVTQAKRDSREVFGQKGEENFRGNQKMFYKTLKEKGHVLKFIKGKDGVISSDPVKVMERWREYFREL